MPNAHHPRIYRLHRYQARWMSFGETATDIEFTRWLRAATSDLLAEQIVEFRPKVAVATEDALSV